MSTIIRTRSPYFIRTPEETDATLSYFSIIINIYDGSQLSSEPCSNYNVSYTLNKKPLGTENSVSFDISEIVNDSLNQEYNGNLSFSNSVKAQSLWVTITTSAKTSAGAPIGSATTTYYLAQEGYNKFKEGVNYTTQKTVLLSENYLEYNKGLKIYLPINAEIANTVTWRYNSSNIQTVNISDTGKANQKIQYISYNPSLQEVNEVVVNTEASGTTIIKLKEIEECKYPVHKITFLNSEYI